MPRIRPAPARPILLALGAVAVLAALAPAATDAAAARVELVGPAEIVPSATAPRALSSKLAELGRIAADRPIDADRDGQTLSLFGREDLIADASSDYRSTACAPLPGAPDVFAEIEKRARATSIVIVNESHERSEHRGFTTALVERLRPLGYDTLAIESLINNPPGTPALYAPPFLKTPGLRYFEDGDGHYVSEAGFGRLGRTAKALGYHLLGYESVGAQPADLSQDQRLALREEGQARNLAAYLRAHPHARLVIHVGYSHVAEVPRADGATWMAARLKAITGIDPLTVSQTTCRGGGAMLRLAALPADQPAGSFDLVVDHPRARFALGRPLWRTATGDRAVRIPATLYPAHGWRVVEARPVDEAVASVPLDRVAIRHGETIALMLPPGRYRLRAIDVSVPAAATPER